MKFAMNRTRWVAVGLWAGCVACLLIAIGLGLATAQDMINRPLGVALTVGFGLAAEVQFWAGGAAMGLSFFAKRGGWLNRLLARRSVEGDAR